MSYAYGAAPPSDADFDADAGMRAMKTAIKAMVGNSDDAQVTTRWANIFTNATSALRASESTVPGGSHVLARRVARSYAVNVIKADDVMVDLLADELMVLYDAALRGDPKPIAALAATTPWWAYAAGALLAVVLVKRLG